LEQSYYINTFGTLFIVLAMGTDVTKKVGRPIGSTDLKMEYLYQTALRVFGDRGFEATTLTEIALEAGITRSSINYHFGSKMELWKRTIDYLTNQFIIEFHSNQKYHKDLDDISLLRVVIRQMVHFWAKDNGFGRMAYREMDQPGERADYFIENMMYPLVNLTKDVFGRLRKQGIIKKFDKQYQLSIILGMVSYIFANSYMFEKMHGVDTKDEALIDQHADAVIDIFFNGIRTGQ